MRWSTLGDRWFSSVLASLDPVALDSVGYDLICTEPKLTTQPDGRPNPSFNGNVDGYLHEAALAAKHGRVLTVEENVLAGGFGSAILELLADRGLSGVSVKRLGIPDIFVEHGAPNILRQKYGLDADDILQAALAALEQPAQTKNVVWGSFN